MLPFTLAWSLCSIGLSMQISIYKTSWSGFYSCSSHFCPSNINFKHFLPWVQHPGNTAEQD